MTIRISPWTHPDTGQVRYYLNNWAKAAGLDYDRYKTGNIRGANFAGYGMSNSRAAMLLRTKVWFGDDGVLHIEMPQKVATDLVWERQQTVEQIVRANLIAALAAIGHTVH